MRLFEIIDVDTRRAVHPSVNFLGHRDRAKLSTVDREANTDSGLGHNTRDSSVLGTGYFYDVDQDEDPHLVNKRSRYAFVDSEDAFTIYYEALKNLGQLNSNIHFPRVYGVKTDVDKDDKEHQTFNVEKLVPYDRLNKGQLLSVLRTFYTEEQMKKAVKKAKKNFEIDSKYGSELELSAYIVTQMVDDIEPMIIGAMPVEAVSEELESAIHTLQKIYDNYHPQIHVDFHEDNVMFRVTPHGAQLVFTDPFS